MLWRTTWRRSKWVARDSATGDGDVAGGCGHRCYMRAHASPENCSLELRSDTHNYLWEWVDHEAEQRKAAMRKELARP